MEPRRLLASAVVLVLLAGLPVAFSEEPIHLQYYVTDVPGVLYSSEVTQIEDLIIQIQENTSAEIAVYIVNTTSPLTIEQFAVATFEQSQLGQKGVDNGVLLVISLNDQRWKIEVGYGLEGVLNDAKVGTIGRAYLEPAFQAGNYSQGVYDTVYAMGAEISGSYAAHPTDFPIPGVPLTTWQLVVVVIIFIVLFVVTRGGVFFWVFSIFRRGGGGRSGGGGAGGKW